MTACIVCGHHQKSGACAECGCPRVEPKLRPNPAPIAVACPHCRAGLKASGALTGRKVTCPKCRKEIDFDVLGGPVPLASPLTSMIARVHADRWARKEVSLLEVRQVRAWLRCLEEWDPARDRRASPFLPAFTAAITQHLIMHAPDATRHPISYGGEALRLMRGDSIWDEPQVSGGICLVLFFVPSSRGSVLNAAIEEEGNEMHRLAKSDESVFSRLVRDQIAHRSLAYIAFRALYGSWATPAHLAAAARKSLEARLEAFGQPRALAKKILELSGV